MNENELAPLIELMPKQQRFVHLYLTGKYNQTELANLLEIDINTVRRWLHNDTIRTYIENFQREEHEHIENAIKHMRSKAINRLYELMDSDNDAVALQATKDVLDRTGHKAVQKIEKDIKVTTIEQQLSQLVDSTIIDVEGAWSK